MRARPYLVQFVSQMRRHFIDSAPNLVYEDLGDHGVQRLEKATKLASPNFAV